MPTSHAEDPNPAKPADPNGSGPATAAGIEHALREALAPLELQVQDDSHLHAGHAGAREGGHYTVRITSERFSGLSRLARHRLVYDALQGLRGVGIHALSIQARSPLD